MDHLAEACGVSAEQIRDQNMYSDGDETPFGMIMGEKFAGQWNVPKMWQRLYKESNYMQRKEAIEKFNSKNTYKKRGISLLPTKFGIAFTAKFMNQGGALVHLYTDGTVLISHGGTEMVSTLLFFNLK
jgi:xanthine dehydrogenase/oxidase